MLRSAFFTVGHSYSQRAVIHPSKAQSVHQKESGMNCVLLFTDYSLDAMPKFLMGKTGKMNPKQKMDVIEGVCGPFVLLVVSKWGNVSPCPSGSCSACY